MKFLTGILFFVIGYALVYFVGKGIQTTWNNNSRPPLSSFVTPIFSSPTPDLEATYKQNFLQNCNRTSNGQVILCNCLYDYLQARYSYADRVQMDLDYVRTKQLPLALSDAVNACTSGVQNSQQNTYLAPTNKPIPLQQNTTSSYRQRYINGCGYGAVYCTCLYDVLSQHYSDYEISNIKENDTELTNAYGVCNSRFHP